MDNRPTDGLSVKVKLLKAHRHQGRLYVPGATLLLTPRDARWLAALKVAEDTGVREQKSRAAGSPGRRAGCCGGRW